MKIIVINGPNMNMLGIREPEIYGSKYLDEINNEIVEFFKSQSTSMQIDFFQSNHEGDIIDVIQMAYGKYDGIVINPGAYTHYSIAIRDALASVKIPTIEVHFSHILGRESFRQISVIKDLCIDQISGKGIDSYIEGLQKLILFIEVNK